MTNSRPPGSLDPIVIIREEPSYTRQVISDARPHDLLFAVSAVYPKTSFSSGAFRKKDYNMIGSAQSQTELTCTMLQVLSPIASHSSAAAPVLGIR